MSLPKYAEIKINNIVATGRFPFKNNLNFNEINKIIEEGSFEWSITNQESSPCLVARIPFEIDTGKKIYFSVWHSGSVYIAGVKSESDLKKVYYQVLKEIKKLTPRVFERREN